MNSLDHYASIDFVCPKTGRVGVSLREYAISPYAGRTNAAIYRPGDPDESPFLPIDTVDQVDHENVFDVWLSSGQVERGVTGETVVFVAPTIAKSLREAR